MGIYAFWESSRVAVYRCGAIHAGTRFKVMEENENSNSRRANTDNCRNPGLNQGPLDLQSNALPTELFRPSALFAYPPNVDCGASWAYARISL